MTQHRHDDGERRQYDYGIPPGLSERRTSCRREVDWTRTLYTTVLDQHMEDTITDEQMEKAITPVMEKIRADELTKPRG